MDKKTHVNKKLNGNTNRPQIREPFNNHRNHAAAEGKRKERLVFQKDRSVGRNAEGRRKEWSEGIMIWSLSEVRQFVSDWGSYFACNCSSTWAIWNDMRQMLILSSLLLCSALFCSALFSALPSLFCSALSLVIISIRAQTHWRSLSHYFQHLDD